MFEFNPNLRRTPPKSWYAPLTDAEWNMIPTAEDGSKSDSPFVTDEGRVFGTLAGLDSCYLNAVRQCIKPSRTAAAYSMAQNRPKRVVGENGKEETIRAGLISFVRGHVPNNVWERIQSSTQPGSVGRYNALRQWYEGPDLTSLADDVENAFATVTYHVDEKRGVVYYTGAVVAHRSDADVEMARSAAVSGDWLRLEGQSERQLAGVCLVNSGAYRNSIKSPRLAASLELNALGVDPNGPERVLIGTEGAIDLEDVVAIISIERTPAGFVRSTIPSFHQNDLVNYMGEEWVVLSDSTGEQSFISRFDENGVNYDDFVEVESALMTSTGSRLELNLEDELVTASTDVIDLENDSGSIPELDAASDAPSPSAGLSDTVTKECSDCDKNNEAFNKMIESMPQEARDWMLSLAQSPGAGSVIEQTNVVEEVKYTSGQSVLTVIDGVPTPGIVGPVLKDGSYVITTGSGTAPINIATPFTNIWPASQTPEGWSWTTNEIVINPVPGEVTVTESPVEELVSAGMTDEEIAAAEAHREELRMKVKRWAAGEKARRTLLATKTD